MTNNLKYKKNPGELKTKIFHLASSFVNAYKPSKNSLKKHKIFKILQEMKSFNIKTG